jgi:hypothetical protein
LISANDRRLLSDCKQEIERLREERDECRRLLREVIASADIGTSCVELVVSHEWLEAARAAGGGG